MVLGSDGGQNKQLARAGRASFFRLSESFGRIQEVLGKLGTALADKMFRWPVSHKVPGKLRRACAAWRQRSGLLERPVS